MKPMRNKLLLLFLCCISFCILSPSMAHVLAFLSSIFFASTIYFFQSKRYCNICSIVYGLFCIYHPAFLLFIPVLFYDSCYYKCYAGMLFLLLEGIYMIFYLPPAYPFFLAMLILFGMVLAMYLQSISHRWNTLDRKYKKSQDDSRETLLLMQEKNKSLLKNQDYEIYNATLQERNRIAREIHDNVGHMLSRAILLMGAIKAVNQSPELALPIEQTENTLSQAMDSIRNSVHDLHDESINLQKSLETIRDSFSFCPVTLEYDMGFEVPKAIKYCFIAIIKEALTNVAKHSNATNVSILVREHPSLFQLIIADNGTKLPVSDYTGIGLTNMQERIANLKGTIQINKKNGYRIFISIPKQT